ncbi:MAG: AsmA family protein [Bdellovibrionota bacterium]
MTRRNKILAVILTPIIFLLILLGIVYYLLSNPQFVKQNIIPRVSAALETAVSLDKIKISPFSGVKITNLNLGTWLTAKEALVKYQLSSLFKGEFLILDVGLKDANLEFESNKENQIKLKGHKSTKNSTSNKTNKDEEKTFKLIFKEINAQNIKVTVLGEATKPKYQVSNLNLKLKDFYPGSTASLKASTAVLINEPQTIEGQLSVDTQMRIDSSWSPKDAKGQINIKQANLKDQQILFEEALVNLDFSKLSPLTGLGDINFTLSGIPDLGRIKPKAEFKIVSTKEGLKVDLNSDIPEVVYKGASLTEIKGPLVWESNKMSTSGLNLLLNGTPASLSGSLKPENLEYEINFSGRDIDLKQLAGLLKTEDSESKLSGTLSEAEVKLSGLKSGIKNGNINLKVKDTDVDQKLQNVFPFNILFLPFTSINKVVSLIPTSIFPDAVLGVLGNVEETISDSQGLVIKEGTIKCLIENGNYNIETAIFNMKTLPTVNFPGTINSDGSLRINSSIGILEHKLPLPIRGTASLPYPDILKFAQELTLEIASTPLNTLKSAGSILEGLDPTGLFSSDDSSESEDQDVESNAL